MGAFWALLATVLWGGVYRLDEHLMSFITPYQLFAIHSLAGLVIGVVMATIDRPQTSITRLESRQWLWIVGTMVTYSIANIAILHSIKILSAARSAALEISYPLFVVVFGIVIFGDNFPSLWFLLGAMLIFGGSYIILTKC